MDDRRRASALVDEAYRALGEAIVDGRLQPGDRLRDVELAALMGISRTPVREALQKLERIGMVEVAANRYTRVSEVSERARGDMREYAAHTIAAVMHIALPRCSDEEVQSIVSHVDGLRDAEDSSSYVLAALALHTHLVAVSRNVVFRKQLEQTDLVLRRNLEGWYTSSETRAVLFEHLRDQIARRDTNGATWTFLSLHGFA